MSFPAVDGGKFSRSRMLIIKKFLNKIVSHVVIKILVNRSEKLNKTLQNLGLIIIKMKILLFVPFYQESRP